MTAFDLLRIACGLFFLPHAAAKLRDRGPTIGLLTTVGLPWPMALTWLGIAIELLAAAGLVFGVAVPVAASAGSLLLFAATAIVLRVSGGAWRWNEGGAEYPAFWGLCCVVVALGA